MNAHRRCLRVASLLVLSVGCGGAHNAASTTPASAHVIARKSQSVEAAPWKSVANPAARYIAVLGSPTAHDNSVTQEHLAAARLLAARTLQSYDDVELAPAHFDRKKLLAESLRRKLPGVAFECGVVHHDVDEVGTHFGVNVTVVDLRSEDIIATLEGRATAPGPTSADAEQQALEGALEGAMRAVPKLLTQLEPTLVSER